MSAKLTARVGTVVQVPFTVYDDIDGSPLVGLVQADFTVMVLQDAFDRTGAVAVAISEVVSGRYVASFTPDARGLWLVTLSAQAGIEYACYVDVGIYDTVETLRVETSNRHEVDFGTQELVAYADDGVTVVQRWPLATDGGEAVTTQVGVQTKRGAPVLPRP